MFRKAAMSIALIVGLAFSQTAYKNEGNARLAPRLLNYQGFITDTISNPINDSIDIIFRICDAASAGNILWSELQTEVPVLKGIFHVLLGSVTPIPDSIFTKGTNRWLEIRISSQNLTPRTQIVSAPYALTAVYADTADCAQLLQGKDTVALDVRFVNEGQANSIFTAMINDTGVTMAKIARAGAAANEVIKWNGSTWAPATDQVGAGASWNFLISDIADTTLQMGGWWGLARPGNVLYGAADSTHVNFGVACTTGLFGLDFKYCTVAGGLTNKASGYYSTVSGGTQNVAGNATGNSCATVGGGIQNSASGNFYATVAGGYSNDASGYTASTVAGGYNNTAGNDYTFVGGGQNNTAGNTHAAILGGLNNTVSGWYSAIGGGNANAVIGRYSTAGGGHSDTVTAFFGGIGAGYNNNAGDAAEDTAATVSGGRDNSAIARYTYVGGGLGNVADSNYATVGGGGYNTAHGFSSVISGGCYGQTGDNYGTLGGGVRDTVKASYGVVVGGYSNLAGDATNDTAAVVCGGWNNSTLAKYTFVGGGYQNTANSMYATVVGGNANTANGDYHTFIGGGSNNSTGNNYAAVCGGLYNNASSQATAIGGGTYNTASADYSAVAGGTGNTASGSQSFVGGGVGNIASYPNSIVSGGMYNVALNNNAAVAGGYRDSSLANYSFTVGNNSTVPASYSNSAAFNGQAATASGETRVGILTKNSGNFAIDHPLDPENKILNHYFVESPEMVLIYRGSAVIGENERAVVHLPDYFDALNKDPMVQLTGIGSADVVYVAEKVKGNMFSIGGKPGTEVYWTVTGARKDPSAEITKILMPVEQPKEGGLANRSLDDEFLVTTMAQLESMGKAGGFKFRHASEQNRYEEMRITIGNK